MLDILFLSISYIDDTWPSEFLYLGRCNKSDFLIFLNNSRKYVYACPYVCIGCLGDAQLLTLTRANFNSHADCYLESFIPRICHVGAIGLKLNCVRFECLPDAGDHVPHPLLGTLWETGSSNSGSKEGYKEWFQLGIWAAEITQENKQVATHVTPINSPFPFHEYVI